MISTNLEQEVELVDGVGAISEVIGRDILERKSPARTENLITPDFNPGEIETPKRVRGVFRLIIA